jgi:thiamine pyrophosphokinase
VDLAVTRHVVVFSGGTAPHPEAMSIVGEFDSAIAADSGFEHALALGTTPSVLVGDLDSISASGLQVATTSPDVRVEQHPSDKDFTDLELALQIAVRSGADQVTVVDGGAGRLDHLLANIAQLTGSLLSTVSVRAVVGSAEVVVVRSAAVLRGRAGEIVSLLAVGDAVTGITTTGLSYALANGSLLPGESRGVSNTFAEPQASISVGAGVLVVIRPEALAPSSDPSAPH